MTADGFAPPDDLDLLRLLEPLRLGRRIRISRREPHLYQSSAPAEVLSLELGGGRRLQLLCKYAGGCRREPGDHRRGVEYEGRAYAELVAKAGVPAVRYYGAPRNPRGGGALLLLEFAATAVRLTQSIREDALRDAARWIGRFQADLEEVTRPRPPAWLTRHDRDHYLARVARARRVARRLGCHGAGLDEALALFEASIEWLLGGPQTVIHGEYYPKNILVRNDAILPVDWESAAAGVGEIDLTTLTSGWGPAVRGACEMAYVAARWPDGAPHGFERRLELARMYVQLCWIEARQQVDELCRLTARLAA